MTRTEHPRAGAAAQAEPAGGALPADSAPDSADPADAPDGPGSPSGHGTPSAAGPPTPPGRPVRHPLRAEAVRGFAPWAGVAVLLALGVTLAGSAARWQGDWGETSSRLHTATLITLPFAAAAGCWQGGRERRRRTEDLWRTAVRGRLARFLAAALPVGLWAAAGQLAASALALLATWPYAQGDRPHLAWLPVDALVLAVAAPAGQVVGRLVPSRLTAPLLAMAGYVGLGVLTQTGGSAASALNPVFDPGDTRVPVWWQPVAMAGWAAGLAAAAVLAYAARRRLTALVPLTAALAAGTLLVHGADGLWRPSPAAGRQVCDTTTVPAVCVNAGYAGMLPQLRAALTPATDRLKGVRNLPARWEDHPGGPGRDEVPLPLLTPVGWSVVRGRLTDPEQFAWEAVTAMRHDADCSRTPDPSVSRIDDAVVDYLAPNPSQRHFDDLDAHGDRAHRDALERRRAARARLAAMSDEARRDWLSAYFATAHDCDPKEVPTL